MKTEDHFKYQKIYEDLKKDIMDGTLQRGSRVPSEKELASAYQVSRITSKRALNMLADEGYLNRGRGRGSFVSFEQNRSVGRQSGGRAGEGKEYKRKIVGVILDNFSIDFGSTLLKGIEYECRRKGYDLFLRCTYGSIEEENLAIRNAVDMGAEGLILMCAQNESYNTTIIQLSLDGFPMVLVDRQMQGISIPCIRTDNYQASWDLTRLLIQKGHKRLCFLTHSSTDTSSVRARYEGFADCIMEHERIYGHMVKITDYDPATEGEKGAETSAGIREIKALVKEDTDCTAFVTVEFQLAARLGRILQEEGLYREVASFDGIPESCRPFAAACIEQDERTMGNRAVDLLDRIIQGESVHENQCVPYRLVEYEREGKTDQAKSKKIYK